MLENTQELQGAYFCLGDETFVGSLSGISLGFSLPFYFPACLASVQECLALPEIRCMIAGLWSLCWAGIASVYVSNLQKGFEALNPGPGILKWNKDTGRNKSAHISISSILALNGMIAFRTEEPSNKKYRVMLFFNIVGK